MEKLKYKYDELINPVLQALHQLDGSGSNDEIEERLVSILELTNDQIEDLHRGNRTKLSYRAAWARNYLKRLGLIENSSRAVWALTPAGLETKSVDKSEAKRIIQTLSVAQKTGEVHQGGIGEVSEEIAEIGWADEIVEVLKKLDPAAFERLSQRLLRELGFNNVEVTGKTGDGGIDGVGVIKLGGVLSFHVVFQCKRYAGTVSSAAIRDFRGAMIGRADKGLFITTGTFSRDAKQEPQRDGAPPIDLVDGNAMAENLKNLGLGVTIKLVEDVTVNRDWFVGL